MIGQRQQAHALMVRHERTYDHTGMTARQARRSVINRLVQSIAAGEPFIGEALQIRAGRGRPKHRYSLTEKGLRQTGSNFTDLALTLWREIRTVGDEKLGRDVLRRISRALAAGYAAQIQGSTPAERLQSLSELLNQRRIPTTVGSTDDGSSLTAHACPYPNLAEEDRSICMMEKMMFSELIGNELELTQCRLNGGGDCRFQTGS